MWKIAKRQNGISNRERGDTLVEVMVAIVVVATVIGGAYVVSNRSLQSTRSAQERGTALKLAESQIEQLKALITDNPETIFGSSAPTKFCLSSDTSGTQVYNTGVPSQKAHCKLDASGMPTTIEPAYSFEITRNGNNFKLVASWVDITGEFSDSIQLNYRAYEQ